MPKETKEPLPDREHAVIDPEHWHGPISSPREKPEFSFLRKLVKDGFAVEKKYKSLAGETIFEVRALIQDSDGNSIEGPLLRFENETLLTELMQKDDSLHDRVKEYEERILQPGGIVLDDTTPPELLEELQGEDTGKGN